MIEILHSDFIIYCFFVYTISNVCLFVCLFAAGNFTFSRFDPENVIPMHLLPRITIFEPERDEIRVKFNFVQLTPKNVNSYVFLLESYNFRVLMRLSRFFLQVTSNMG